MNHHHHQTTLLSSFFGLDVARHGDLINSLEALELPGGQWLFRQGDPGDSLYLLARGRLEAWDENAEAGATLLNEIVPGEAVGEVALLTQTRRSAGVRARRDSLLFRMDRATLEKLAVNHPALVLQISANVAKRLASNTDHRGGRPPARTIALMVLADQVELDQYADRLAEDLSARGQGLVLSPARLRADGVAGAERLPDEAPGPEFKQWLSACEDRHERLVFMIKPGQSEWAEFALRQADLIVELATTASGPIARNARLDDMLKREERSSAASMLLLHHPAGQPISGSRDWLEGRSESHLLHVRADHAGDHARAVRILSGQAVGLVLGGGAVRGLAHIGVFRAMEDLGVPVDWIGGTSMGAMMAACLACGWDSAEAVQQTRPAFLKERPLTDYTLPVLSLMRGQRMRRLIQRYFPGDIEDLPIPFFAISSNLNNGEINVHERGVLWRALCASASLPGLFPPTVHERELTIDGAMLNNLPVDVMQARPVGHVIAVSLTARKQRLVDYEDAPSPWSVVLGKLFPWAGRRARVPGAASMMLKAIELGTRKRVQELGEQADLLIRPPVERFNMIDVKQFDDLVETGYQAARESLEAWLADQPRK